MSRPCRKCQSGSDAVAEIITLGFISSGTGYVKCPKCRGEGELRDGRVCHRCNGDGKVECPRCGGSGTLD